MREDKTNLSQNKNVMIVEADGKQVLDDEDDVESAVSINAYKWYYINVEFLPAKFGYFFEEAKKIGYLPNQILFLTSVGMTKSESGIILGLR